MAGLLQFPIPDPEFPPPDSNQPMPDTFHKILIANRGEIACRIARTARRMGIRSVAVYAEAERGARHVAACDEAVWIGAAAAAESYLRGQRIVEAALECGAEAIHPGYGFLSENPEFAELCADNDLVFIGPPPQAIRAMGGKNLAKDCMAAAGVPVLGGYHGADQSIETLRAAAEEAGYPALIKAVAGGGGKGMRLVARAEEFDAALATVQRESSAAFGDQRVLIERYLPRARHVEVQIFADRHGNTVHLFERDCSIQRRHQKIIEEAPAPGIDDQLRGAMGAAAVSASQSIGYVGAGTVEFLLAPDRRFYFMEMNTRLQVEHPVTEMITGQDLVEWQLQVAAGLPLPCAGRDLRIRGHAMEARIYAENPDNDFLPATGTLAVYRHEPELDWRRVDSGVAQGDGILPHYDPMIAKLIVWGADRESARKRLRSALAGFDIAGVTTNLDFLHRVTGLEDFIAPVLDTALIERNAETLFADRGGPPELCLAIAALFELGAAAGGVEYQPQPPDGSGGVGGVGEVGGVQTTGGDPFSPWAPGIPWQLNLPGEAAFTFAAHGNPRSPQPKPAESTYTVHFEQDQPFGVIDGERRPIALTPLPRQNGRFQFHHGARSQPVSVDKVADTLHLKVNGNRWALAVVDALCGDGSHAARAAHAAHAGNASTFSLAAPMPGAVIAVRVEENQRVRRGAPLLLLEAMKMEHTISAPHDGVVKQLFFAPGDQVREGETLLILNAESESGSEPEAPEE